MFCSKNISIILFSAVFKNNIYIAAGVALHFSSEEIKRITRRKHEWWKMVCAVFSTFLFIFKQKNVLALIQNIYACSACSAPQPRCKFPFVQKLPVHVSDNKNKKERIYLRTMICCSSEKFSNFTKSAAMCFMI